MIDVNWAGRAHHFPPEKFEELVVESRGLGVEATRKQLQEPEDVLFCGPGCLKTRDFLANCMSLGVHKGDVDFG